MNKRKKCWITRCKCDNCETFGNVAWRVHFPDGYTMGLNTWQQALDTAHAYWDAKNGA